ncbi:hypothetical protein FHS72_001238 [Loktanella ponticola]|uniref:TVP38/TMEM64 family membrane protein n=1 Tax=Yoonia ponticola TaxID=1524255 RepID=A0A7W9BJG0_9RHOB|nr:hypothetical protein [Yoonia ponticola]MBB5721626.1 hypothetical protein [Yoonia ponticola]
MKQRPSWRRALCWVAGFGLCVFVLHLILNWSMDFVSGMNAMSGSGAMIGLIAVSLVIYALLIATPFMPGIEVGIALLMLKGASVAPFVYLATVVGLMVAYVIGQTIPLAWLHKVFRDLRLKKACAFIDRIETTPPAERQAAQRALLPAWLAKLTIDYRYATIGLLLNVPGTFAIGGGGGILMAAGLSRLFSGWAIFVTLLVATLPVPLVVWVMGVSVLG